MKEESKGKGEMERPWEAEKGEQKSKDETRKVNRVKRRKE